VPSPTLAPTALLAAAAAPLAEIVDYLRPEHLTLPTPCAEYDVRGLVHHLLFWGPSLDGSARGAAVPPPAAAEGDLDLVVGGWRAVLAEQVAEHVAAWSEPAAWEGTTRMGRSPTLPAPVVGGMVLGELVVHGWDLGRALGRRPAWDDELLAVLLDQVRAMAAEGRRMGVFGPEVVVAPTAPRLHQVLGATGRDPEWRL
jgi:uncharacterized protein (TIGR03086 family)